MLLSSSKYTMQYDFKITFIQRPLFGQKEPYSADGTLETSVRVRLSTSVNVSSNNSLRAEAFVLIMFEYVTFCFIRFYLLMPRPKMIANCNLQGEKNIHIYCRTLTADCTLASLQKQNFRFISSCHWRWNCFFSSDWTSKSSRSSRPRSAIKPRRRVSQSQLGIGRWEQTWVALKSRPGASSPKCSLKWTYRNLMKMDLQSLKA